ncbi:hypothetical protein F975_02735 [Acinetobacter sp. ANC 3789]|uniref:ABC transporter ATP-binding protein n=1 Tax=Acinetobacter sp. ANC 3789 TaxID=1217714 RepID=UPI0002D09F6F|nr:ABC transporter ATP-binding protein [Acinetobacter sp. ANC 3789]ENU79489.1 hypothetical protein F975_02735 [Acinetobacter sp. ANC 3789]
MFKTLQQLWEILTPLDKQKLLLVFCLVIFMAMIEAIGVISIMPFLAVLSNASVIEVNPLLKKLYLLTAAQDNRQFIVYLGFISLFIVVFSSGFKIVTQYALNRFSSLQRHYFSTRLLRIYLKQKYEFFIQRNSSLLVNSILNETDQLVWSMIQPALLILSYGIVACAMVAILLFYDPLMAVLTAIVLVSFYLMIYKIVKQRLNLIGKTFAEASQQRHQSCQEALEGIKDVIINHAQQAYIDQFEHYSRIFSRNLATKDTLGQIPLHVVETVAYGCLIILAITLVISGKDVAHILPVLGLYGFAAYRMLPAAQNIYRSVTQIKFSENVFNSIKQEFALEELIQQEENKSGSLAFNREIQLRNIEFAYPNRLDKKIFTDFNLTIHKNQSIGIVGKSGCGKSTLMDILLGLLHPQKGQVYIDDVQLTDRNHEAWYRLVGYVPQTIYLADKTIAENIAFGVPTAQIDMDAVIKAAQIAQIHEFIQSNLEDSYQTMIGERGVMLSGGQRQRLGIARALYKDPEILFMDEATSALDTETEYAVNEAIRQLNGKKTLIIIAHRESSVKDCHQLIHF